MLAKKQVWREHVFVDIVSIYDSTSINPLSLGLVDKSTFQRLLKNNIKHLFCSSFPRMNLTCYIKYIDIYVFLGPSFLSQSNAILFTFSSVIMIMINECLLIYLFSFSMRGEFYLKLKKDRIIFMLNQFAIFIYLISRILYIRIHHLIIRSRSPMRKMMINQH